MIVEKFKQMVEDSDNIVFFGGTGVSTESNIPDFRSTDGLYSGKSKPKFKYPPETMLSHSFFVKHTKEFFEFYKEQMIYKDAKPNDAHKVLAELERMGKLKAVITQNIDGLHQVAGSKRVYELHGSIMRNHCIECNEFFDLEYILKSEGVPHCSKCNGVVKPDVVLYEESLDMGVMEKSIAAISNADVFIVGGTSLTVYPAAGLIRYYNGDKLVLINKSETPYDKKANLIIRDKIGETLKQVI